MSSTESAVRRPDQEVSTWANIGYRVVAQRADQRLETISHSLGSIRVDDEYRSLLGNCHGYSGPKHCVRAADTVLRR